MAFVVLPLAFLLFYIAKLMYQGITDQRSTKSRGAQLPPGPVPWPVVGCMPKMLRRRPAFRWILGWMKEMDTDIACFCLGNMHVIPVTCPKIAQEFLKKQDAIFASRPLSMASRILSSGYITAVMSPYGESWKKMRKVLISEVISPARHRWLHDKRTKEADNLVSKNSGRVNIRTACQHYSANMVRRLMFDRRYFVDKITDDGAPTFREEEYVDALFTTLKYLYAFCVSDYLPYLEGLDLDGHEKIIKDAVEIVRKYHDPIVKERILKWRENDGRVFRGENEFKMMEPQDLLDVLITLKDANEKPLLTPEEITAETREIVTAAVDNPSNAVEWVMAEMINNPEIINNPVEELDRVVGKERIVRGQDIPNLNYIKACAREAFRLHPFAPFNVPHVALSDTVVAGYHIPQGSHIFLRRRGLGRNPKVWDRPLEFRPEQHLPNGNAGNGQECSSNEVVLTEPDLRFITFSTGWRGCVAMALGTTMTIMLLARMVQGFSWEKPPEISKINLEESEHELCLADPLVACAEPRLPIRLYQYSEKEHIHHGMNTS
ncbi:tyrosine N-monooxygenase-like [Punica granatum]|uniref:Tyrosine N-monooxygenase-like n=1 Tax=Punica granatum TaxID=22663 RepID=A0A6P8C1J0_PUNGR|nr:tyrosine N-monooxygenase-like [Punica granatum]